MLVGTAAAAVDLRLQSDAVNVAFLNPAPPSRYFSESFSFTVKKYFSAVLGADNARAQYTVVSSVPTC